MVLAALAVVLTEAGLVSSAARTSSVISIGAVSAAAAAVATASRTVASSASVGGEESATAAEALLPNWLKIRPPARAHLASDQERAALGESLTYGELTEEGAINLAKLLAIEASGGEEFIDLGSGE